MTDKEYEQQRRECWEEYIAKHGLEYAIPEESFVFAFDRAYALGKQENKQERMLTPCFTDGFAAMRITP